MKVNIWRHCTLLTGCLLIASCSGISVPTTLTNANQHSSNSDIDPNTIFSALEELDYSPKARTYQITQGDVLDVQVFKAPEFSKQETVNLEGYLTLPLIGDIQAEGLTISQLEHRVTEKLREKYLQNPKVIIVSRARGTQYITLDGSFRVPGSQQLRDTPMNVIQVMALGGGLDDLADTDKVVLFRRDGDKVKAYHLDIDSMKNGKAKTPYIRGNDIIIASRSNTRFWLREIATSMGNIGTILGTYSTYNPLFK